MNGRTVLSIGCDFGDGIKCDTHHQWYNDWVNIFGNEMKSIALQMNQIVCLVNFKWKLWEKKILDYWMFVCKRDVHHYAWHIHSVPMKKKKKKKKQ